MMRESREVMSADWEMFSITEGNPRWSPVFEESEAIYKLLNVWA